MLSRAKSRAISIPELLITLAIGIGVIGFVFWSYTTLQHKFALAINWSETGLAQARVIDSMAQDIRNATAVTVNGNSLPLTLTIPVRFNAYETTGILAGDPAIDGTLNALAVDSTTGKIGSNNGNLTVTYEQIGNAIIRRVTQSGVTPDITRTVATFGAGVRVSFISESNTIVSVVSGTPSGITSPAFVATETRDTVFKRAASLVPSSSSSPSPTPTR